MPAFDPVRDAVLNSPIIQNYPMPNHFLHTEQQPSPAISSPLASPSLSRRATDLSVLLNSDPPESPVRVSPSSRSGSHLSHILHDDEALGYSEPLRRTTQPWQSPAASTSASRPSSSSSSSLPQATPRTTVSPAMSFQPVAQPIPYAPKQRRTPAQSVLLPLSAEEIQTFASYRGTGTLRLTNKRKRAMSDQPDDQPPGKKLAGDVGMVVQHCESCNSLSQLPLNPCRQSTTRSRARAATGIAYHWAEKLQQLGQVGDNIPVWSPCAIHRCDWARSCSREGARHGLRQRRGHFKVAESEGEGGRMRRRVILLSFLSILLTCNRYCRGVR